MATLNDIPEGLLLKIFTAQPVKSLLRLTSVCKLWYQLINSDFFVKSHLAYQKSSLFTNKTLFIRHRGSYSTNLVDGEPSNNVFESHGYDMLPVHSEFNPNVRLRCYGICDGLVCLSHGVGKLRACCPVYLWNPGVRRVLVLPPMVNDPDQRVFNYSYLCFGQHEGDYKVISVVPMGGVYKVYVYSLNQDSWDLLEFYDESKQTSNFDIWPHVWARFVNGAAYFVSGFSRPNRGIVCFDLSRKVIRRMNLPHNDFCVYNFLMEEYQGSIALIENDGDDHQVDVWELRANGNDNSYLWNKKLSMTPETMDTAMGMGTHLGAFGFVNKDKVVLWMTGGTYSGYKYFLLNLENKSVQPFTIPERYFGQLDRHVNVLYDLTESLVLLAKNTT
ncbi:hypothetical protein DCAR_0729879 [Daucus carota subsp. sativus]|uniref:F-box domain-containing protein n=1 Tax=Daucus carota subsp. sativus TaxID=79200 RepID=A0A164UIY0_DAUCS|nr:PREDICTED: putative F-box protein At3g16210 [Daucus carota subsp. sativus]WOH10410.1 hypothetical protein DCAR_0729879 [Daucus carota subsp. sativus]